MILDPTVQLERSCISLFPSLGVSFHMENDVGGGLMISEILFCSKILCSVAVQQEVVKRASSPRKALGYFAH